MTRWYKSPLFFFHLATHASVVPMFLYADLSDYFIALIFYYLFGCWGVAITYHRLISHKAFVSPKWFKTIGLILGSLGGVGTSIQWTAVHRKHHRYSDTDQDPHNPNGRFWTMQFFPMLVQSSERYVPDLLRDKQQVWFHKNYWYIHAVYTVALLAIDPFAIVYAYLFPCLVLWHVMSALGTFAHADKFGYATYPNKARNLPALGWLAFGEGWHNNHHEKASSARFGEKPWEFDLSWEIIKRISK